MRRVVPIAVLAGVAACAAPAQQASIAAPMVTAETVTPAALTQGPEDAFTRPVPYDCADGAGFTALYPANGRSVVVRAGGRDLTLDLVEEAVLPAYARDGVSFAATGDRAALTGFNRVYSACRTG